LAAGGWGTNITIWAGTNWRVPDNSTMCSGSTGIFVCTGIYTLSVFTCCIVRTFIIRGTTNVQAGFSRRGHWKINFMHSCIWENIKNQKISYKHTLEVLQGLHAVNGSPLKPCTQVHSALWLKLLQIAFSPQVVALQALMQFPSWQMSVFGQSSFTTHWGLTWTKKGKDVRKKSQPCNTLFF